MGEFKEFSEQRIEEAQLSEELNIEAQVHLERIKSSLDCLTAYVMVTDTQNIITYANPAVLGMLRNAESDIRKVLPTFNSDNVVGSSVDIFHKNPAHQQRMLASLQSTHKADLDVGRRKFSLVITPVISEQTERLGTVVEWKDRTEQAEFLDRVEHTLTEALDGNLAGRIDIEGSSGPLQKLGLGINEILEIFDETITDIADSSVQIKEASGEISSGNTNLSQRTEEQAASLEETSAAMEEITTTVQQNAANAVQANSLARGAREAAENGGAVVGKAVSAMEAISESSNKITDIIGVIDEIAFQTNLLALNAAVEAARAGDQGRGFAVVADEVRSLAGRSATAAKEIKELIKDSSEKVQEGSDLVNKSGNTLEEIVTAVKKVNDIVAEISTASDEQASGLDEINRAIGEMDSMTQQNAALVEEAAAASEELLGQTEALDGMVGHYETSAEPRELASPPTRSVAPSAPAREARPAQRPAPAAKPVSEEDEGNNWSKF